MTGLLSDPTYSRVSFLIFTILGPISWAKFFNIHLSKKAPYSQKNTRAGPNPSVIQQLIHGCICESDECPVVAVEAFSGVLFSN